MTQERGVNNEHNDMKFICNPGYELIQSLYVLNEPMHHESMIQWAGDTWNKLSVPLKREIRKLFNGNKGWSILSDFWTISPGFELDENCSDEEMKANLRGICELNDPFFSWVYLGLTTEDVTLERVGEWIEDGSTITPEEWKILTRCYSKKHIENYLDNRQEARERLYYVVSTYWDEYFKNIWPTLCMYMKAESDERVNLWKTAGLEKYISVMHKDIIIDGDYYLFLKEPDYGLLKKDITETRMMISVFSTPHLMVNIIGSLLTGSFNLDFRYSVLKKGLSDTSRICISALNDKTRLNIIKYIWNDFHTTQEIAKAVGISESGVSLHIKLLKEAELVDGKRIKKHVFYRIREGAIEDSLNEIMLFLGAKD